MSNACPLYAHLKDRLAELSQKFLKDQIASESADPIGFQPDFDRLAAFRLLMHAEIEDFLERKAKENLSAISSTLAEEKSLIAYPELFSIAAALKRSFGNSDIFDLAIFKGEVAALINCARKVVAENNGIKENSFNALSVFAGKSIDQVDSTLSASLNSYGKDRGEVAHQSAVRVRSMNAPSAELSSAQNLVTELGNYFRAIASTEEQT